MRPTAFLDTLPQLPVKKRRRISKIRDNLSQLQSIIGLKLLQHGFKMLGYRNFHLQKLKFRNNKPHIPNQLHFSISHSEQCICCVISKTGEVGIDTEKTRPLSVSLVEKYQLDQPGSSAIKNWTRKEAVLKVDDTNKLHAINNIQLNLQDALFNNTRYYTKSFFIRPHFYLSVASKQAITKTILKRVYF